MKNNPIINLFLFLVISNLSAKIIIKDISLQGNNLIKNSQIKQVIQSNSGDELNLELLYEDCKRISDLYEEKGFYNVVINLPKVIPQNNDAYVTIQIEEKEEIYFNEIEVEGNSYISNEKLRNGITELNSGFYLNETQKVLSQLIDFYANRGFLFASAKVKKISVKMDKYSLIIKIDEGKYCRFQNFRFKGNKITKGRSILKIARIKHIKKYNLKKLKMIEENLRKKEYILKAKTIPLDCENLLIRIEEGNMTKIAGVLGYDNKRKTNKFAGYFELGFANLFGTDRKFEFLWESLTEYNSLVRLYYFDSGLYDYPFSGDIQVERETQDSTYIRTSLTTNLYYNTLNYKVGIMFGFDDYFPGSRRPILVEKNLDRKVGTVALYDNVDYQINPKSGLHIRFLYYWLFDSFKKISKSKDVTELSITKYEQILDNFVLSLSLNGKNKENRDLESYHYFKLGGNKDLRGFNEDQFIGYRIGWSNLELRYLLTRESRFFIFTDYGYAEYMDSDKKKVINDLFGFGVGLRIKTQIGILGIDYGFNYSDGELQNPLEGIIHFGLETNF